MKAWLKQYLLPLMVALAVLLITGQLDFSPFLRLTLFFIITLMTLFLARLFKESETPADGKGGCGGGGNAVGTGSMVIGGKGGRGGELGMGRGGDGGGGDAVGDGSMVIGGDGGDAGRFDGRGGMGGASPLKRLPIETLMKFGLTGNEGYGQGGRGGNSVEYDRSLKVLNILSAEYVANNPNTLMTPMPGVLMPPVDWVNRRLAQMGETFRIEIIDNYTDFVVRSNK